VSIPEFDFDEVFNEDYLYFYEPLLAEVTDADVDAIWRLLELERGSEILDLACGHGRIANRLAERGARVTGLDATPLFLDRARRDAAARDVEVDYVDGDMRSDGNLRRCSFSVRMFIAVELRDWLLDAGFDAVNFLDANGDALTAHSRRMITIAHR
jgi:SAM-dependent methyltransferase